MTFGGKYPSPSCYDKPIKIHPRRKRGYVRFYDPEHPLCDCCGIVYFHRHVVSVKLGRWIEADEVVHHIDGDTEKNTEENLDVFSGGEHVLLHAKLSGYETKTECVCTVCGKLFLALPRRNRKYCSQKCTAAGRRIFRVIDRDTLERLVWEKPTRVMAAELGVSDTAIAKRCKQLGVEKPPRGYWAKVYSKRGVAQK